MDRYRRDSYIYATCTLAGVALIVIFLNAAHLSWLNYVGIALAAFGLSRSWSIFRKRYYPKKDRNAA